MNYKHKILTHPRIARYLSPKLRFIADLRNDAFVLDIGCYKGGSIQQIMKMKPSVHPYASDINEMRSYLATNVKFSQFDAAQDQFPYEDDFFDAIFCCQVFEHISKPHNFHMVSEIFRILRPGASLFVDTPGLRRLFMPSLKVGIQYRGGINFLDDYTHVSLFTISNLYYLLNDRGFEVVHVGIERNLIYLISSPVLILFGLLTGNRRWVILGLQHLFGLSIYAVARRPHNTKN